jgi:hypothetical protein
MFRPEIRKEKFKTPGPVLENGNEKTMVLNVPYEEYRIYLCLSQEILDTILSFYLSFDLYVGQLKLKHKKYRIQDIQ